MRECGVGGKRGQGLLDSELLPIANLPIADFRFQIWTCNFQEKFGNLKLAIGNDTYSSGCDALRAGHQFEGRPLLMKRLLELWDCESGG
jgi:hypothetical protein